MSKGSPAINATLKVLKTLSDPEKSEQLVMRMLLLSKVFMRRALDAKNAPEVVPMHNQKYALFKK